MKNLRDGEKTVTFVALKGDVNASKALQLIEKMHLGAIRVISSGEKLEELDVVLFTMSEVLSKVQCNKWFGSLDTSFKIAGHHFFDEGAQDVLPKDVQDHPFLIGLPRRPNGSFEDSVCQLAGQYLRWFNNKCIDVPWGPLKSNKTSPALLKWLEIAEQKLNQGGVFTTDSLIQLTV